jgi:hypothetical protein
MWKHFLSTGKRYATPYLPGCVLHLYKITFCDENDRLKCFYISVCCWQESFKVNITFLSKFKEFQNIKIIKLFNKLSRWQNGW